MLKQKNNLLRLLLFFLGLLFSTSAFSQWVLTSSRIGETSIYAGAGITKLYGDIGGYAFEKFILNDANTSYAAGFRYTSPYRIGFSVLSEISNHYQGDDKNTHLDYRQMAFKSKEWGISGQLEITLLGGTYMSNYNPHTLYTFGGGGYANSRAQFLDPNLVRPTDKAKNNEVVESFNLFGGFGYQYRLSSRWALGAEYRATQFFSDYIDGYHPQFSKRDDMSMDLRVTLAYFFNLNIGGKKIWDCNCDYDK